MTSTFSFQGFLAQQLVTAVCRYDIVKTNSAAFPHHPVGVCWQGTGIEKISLGMGNIVRDLPNRKVGLIVKREVVERKRREWRR